MHSTLLVHLDRTAINPASVDAVWKYTAGDVVVNVRAGGMTFKQTYMVDREGTDAEVKAHYAAAEAQAEDLFQGILGIMYEVANRDTP
jgi:hypothetical protein